MIMKPSPRLPASASSFLRWPPTLRQRHRLAAAAVVVATTSAACAVPRPGSDRGGDTEGNLVDLWLEPEAPLDAAMPVTRVHLRAAGPIDTTGLHIFRGELSQSQLDDLAEGHASAGVTARMLPAVAWSDAQDPGHAIVAPGEVLDPGSDFTLVATAPPVVRTLSVTNAEPPMLRRAWPPPDIAETAVGAIWCGDEPLPPVDEPAVLEPHGPEGALLRGAMASSQGLRCVRFDALDDGAGADLGPYAPPLAVSSGEHLQLAALEPTQLVKAALGGDVPPLACQSGEIPFGRGCAHVDDDRLRLRTPAEPLMWSVLGGGLDVVVSSAPGESFVIYPLPPGSPLTFSVIVLDAGMNRWDAAVAATTTAARAHLVINEVLANPVGDEPAQEWVELYNDGLAAGDLADCVLLDPGGKTPLPPTTVAPGSYVLLVNESFDASPDFDLAPAPGTVVVRVPKLGKNGLNNQGEPLILRDGLGHDLSRFEPDVGPEAGRSVARVSPHAPDDAATSYVLAATPTPGAVN